MEDEILDYLYELGVLKRVRRSGWWLAGICEPESVAEHVFRTAVTAYFLARIEGADAGKAAVMALLHDTEEARITDLHRLARSYLDVSKAGARVERDQTERLPPPLRESTRELVEEARHGTSLEARVVKDADLLECLLQAREYAIQGYPVEEWIQSCVAEVKLDSARRLARAALHVDPTEWRRRARAGTDAGDIA
jgi:putative hydrolase of HD superfamily